MATDVRSEEAVLIAGCGYLGTAVGALLARLGQTVYGLRRDPSGLPDSITPLAGDLTEPRSLALPAVDALVFAAAPGRRGEEAYRAVYRAGLEAVLDALESAGHRPRRAIFVSSTAVYGQNDGSWVDEQSQTDPPDFRGAVMLAAEEHLGARVEESIALRLGGLYGPGRTRLIESVLNGASEYVAHPPRYTNRVHRDDAALIVAHLLELDDPERIYNGVDTEPAPQAEVLNWLAERLDAPMPRPVDRPSTGSAKRVRCARLLESGYDFRFPTFRDGYENVIAAMGESLWNRADGSPPGSRP